MVPLYFAKERPVVERDGALIMVDDERLPLLPGENPRMKRVRFRTLGCYPLTGAFPSTADTLDAIIDEMRASTSSERQGRVIDHDESWLDGKEEARGLFLMDAPDRHACRSRALPMPTRGRPCAFSPAARSTTASRR